MSARYKFYYRRFYFSSTCENRSNDSSVFFFVENKYKYFFSNSLEFWIDAVWNVCETYWWKKSKMKQWISPLFARLHTSRFEFHAVYFAPCFLKKILLNSNIFIISFHNILPFVLFANINSHFKRQILQAPLLNASNSNAKYMHDLVLFYFWIIITKIVVWNVKQKFYASRELS